MVLKQMTSDFFNKNLFNNPWAYPSSDPGVILEQ